MVDHFFGSFRAGSTALRLSISSFRFFFSSSFCLVYENYYSRVQHEISEFLIINLVLYQLLVEHSAHHHLALSTMHCTNKKSYYYKYKIKKLPYQKLLDLVSHNMDFSLRDHNLNGRSDFVTLLWCHICDMSLE